jgi:secreted trypsin-like serine protease
LFNHFITFSEGISACEGDSGGGLVLQADDGTYYLRGIVSHTINGTEEFSSNFPAVFTDVAGYRKWIAQKLGPDNHFDWDNN